MGVFCIGVKLFFLIKHFSSRVFLPALVCTETILTLRARSYDKVITGK